MKWTRKRWKNYWLTIVDELCDWPEVCTFQKRVQLSRPTQKKSHLEASGKLSSRYVFPFFSHFPSDFLCSQLVRWTVQSKCWVEEMCVIQDNVNECQDDMCNRTVILLDKGVVEFPNVIAYFEERQAGFEICMMILSFVNDSYVFVLNFVSKKLEKKSWKSFRESILKRFVEFIETFRAKCKTHNIVRRFNSANLNPWELSWLLPARRASVPTSVSLHCDILMNRSYD